MVSAMDERTKAERILAGHILPVSCTMVGVCITLVGLVRLAEARIGPSHVDELAALIGLMFLGSAIASYVSIRYANWRTFSTRCELLADGTFLVGLVSIVIVGCFFAYEII
jgi:hypothetical protein